MKVNLINHLNGTINGSSEAYDEMIEDEQAYARIRERQVRKETIKACIQAAKGTADGLRSAGLPKEEKGARQVVKTLETLMKKT